MIDAGGDLAIVVGGYNSSNTSHLVELCEAVVPTFYIKDVSEIESRRRIRHLDMKQSRVVVTRDWLPTGSEVVEVLITAGASCPDVLVDQVISRVASFFAVEDKVEIALAPYQSALNTDQAVG